MSQPTHPIRFHRHPLSGHAHRVELLLTMLDLPFEVVEVDMMKGAHKAPEFVARSPFGQVPVIEDDGAVLADSNAILVYLATRYNPARQWLPADPVVAARVQQWLSVAAGQLAYGPAAARRAALFRSAVDRAQVDGIAAQLFTVLERHLDARPFLAAEHPTIADLAMYSYTAHADEGGISLEPYPRVRAWLERVEALPKFVPMRRTKVQ